MPAGAIDVGGQLDGAAFSLYQKLLLCLCFMIVFVDGYDVQIMAVAAPSVDQEFQFGPAKLGAIFAIGTLGGVLASFSIAPIADALGRRPLIIGALLLSGLLSFCYGWADGFGHLMVLRLVIGFFLAVAATVTYSYAGEVGPKRAAAMAVIVSSTGYALGVAATGFTSGWIIPEFGWRAMFYLSGGVTLLLVLLLLWLLPESPRVLALRGGQERRIAAFLRRMDPSVRLDSSAGFYLNEERKPGLRFGNLLSEGRLLPGLGIWATIFLVNFVIYVFMQWLPSLIASSGGDPAQAGSSIGWFKIGGIIGSFICAAYIDRRRNPYPILTTFLVISCGLLLVMRGIPATAAVFILLVFLIGMALSGPQYSMNGLTARLFPTYVRTAGMAMYTGVGRLGSMSGPFTVGFLLQAGWSNEDLLRAALAPIALAILITTLLALRARKLDAFPQNPEAAGATKS